MICPKRSHNITKNRTKRVTFTLDPDIAADLETLSRLVGIRQYKGRLVNLLLQRGLGPYQPAIARSRNGQYAAFRNGPHATVGPAPIIRRALAAEVDVK